MSVRQFTREEAEELARLTRIACAEVGIPADAISTCEINGRWYPSSPLGDDSARKAALLAIMHHYGPNAEASCQYHAAMFRITDGTACGLVTVTDALLGRLCHKAAAHAQ